MKSTGTELTAVVSGDVVGYTGDGEFVILKPVRSEDRKLPPMPGTGSTAWGFPCKVEDEQIVYFRQRVFILRNTDGEWFYHRNGAEPMVALEPSTFFEIIDP